MRRRVPAGTTGLFHLAILVPSRLELARALRRVADAGWHFTGASDHLVSEALYLNDPEGNGIEIYRDRPRDEWRYTDGQLEMATLPLDLDSLLASSPAPSPTGSRCRRTPVSGMSTSTSPSYPPRSRSTPAGSGSTSPCAGIRARCSCRRAATTTTSA